MNALRRYSVACSVANLSVALVLTCMTNLFAWKAIEIRAWWGHAILAGAGLLLYGYIVQWWLSIPVNVALRRLFLRKEGRGKVPGCD